MQQARDNDHLDEADDTSELVEQPTASTGKVLDLMAALEASVGAAKTRRKAGAKPAKRTRKSA